MWGNALIDAIRNMPGSRGPVQPGWTSTDLRPDQAAPISDRARIRVNGGESPPFLDVDGDGGAPDARRFRVEADDVSQVDRLVKLDFVHRAGDVAVRRRLPRLDRGRQVDMGQDDAAEVEQDGLDLGVRHDRRLNGRSPALP